MLSILLLLSMYLVIKLNSIIVEQRMAGGELDQAQGQCSY
jgi:hypothetical protein